MLPKWHTIQLQCFSIVFEKILHYVSQINQEIKHTDKLQGNL